MRKKNKKKVGISTSLQMNYENHITQKLLISVKLYLCKRYMCYAPVYIRVADPLIKKLCKIKEMPMFLITDFF